MTLEEFKVSTDFKWDIASKTIYEDVTAKSGDVNGRKMRVQIVNGTTVVDLTGYTLNLGWKSTIDPTKKGLDAFDVVDITQGIFEIAYTTAMLSNIGRLVAALQLVGVADVTESNNFVITVTQSAIDADAIQTESSFTALTEALVLVNGWNTTIDGKVTDWEADMEATKQTYITTMNDVEATYPQEIISLGQQLEQKADLADLPSSAYTFKGSTTFSALPTTGNTLGDVRYATDTLLNYAWTGTAWTPIGNGAFANLSVVTGKLADEAVTTPKTADGAITIEKTAGLFEVSGNYYNYATRTDGYTIDLATGEPVANASYSLSDFIYVKGLSGRWLSALFGLYGARACYFGYGKAFLSGVENLAYTTGRKIPVNTEWIRISTPLNQKLTQMLVITKTQPTVAPTFENYVRKLQGVNIDYSDVINIPTPDPELYVGPTQTFVNLVQETISIGTDAARNDGNASIAIGTGALKNLVPATTTDDGKYNTAVGHAAGKNNTLGDHNTFIGWSAGADNTIGDGNTAVGEDALLHNVDGSSNVAVGNRAYQSGVGDRNTVIGASAMYFGDGVPTGDGNTSVGYGAGSSDGVGEYNVTMGYWAKTSVGVKNSVAIGSNATATKDNEVRLGGSLTTAVDTFGDFEVLTNGRGLILRSPNGSKFKLTVSDAGALTTTAVV